MNTKEIIGLKLRQKRIENNISLDEVARFLNTNKSTVSRWEQLGISDIEKINSYCEFLNCDFNEICFGSPITNKLYNQEEFKYNSFKYDIILPDTDKKTMNCQLINDCRLNKNIACFTNDTAIINECYGFFKENGYAIKILNLVNLEEGNFYNPFYYFNTDLDVVNFVSNFIKCTNNNENTKDPFWEKSETALLQALMFYLIKYRPKEDQNFTSVMKLLRAAEIDENNPNVKSPLDLIFYQTEKEEPTSIAVKQYRTFKMGAGKTIKSIVSSCSVRLQTFDIKKIENFTMYDNLKLDDFIYADKYIIFVVPPIHEPFNILLNMFNYQLNNIIKIYDSNKIDNNILQEINPPVIPNEKDNKKLKFTNNHLYDIGLKRYLENNGLRLIPKEMQNYYNNSLICGLPGSGKSVIIKNEIANILSLQNDNVFVVGRKDEYRYLLDFFNSKEISACTNEFNKSDFNILKIYSEEFDSDDIDLKPDDGETVTKAEEFDSDDIDLKLHKIEFLQIICLMLVKNLTVKQKTIVDKCLKDLYNERKDPSFLDFIRKLNNYKETKELEQTLYKNYSNGLFDYEIKTNGNDINSKLTFYESNSNDIKLLIYLENIWMHVIKNCAKNIKDNKSTYLFIDVEDKQLKNPYIVQYLNNLLKRARTYGLKVVISIQDIGELKSNEDTCNMIRLLSNVILLKQSNKNLDIVKEMYDLSDEDIEYLKTAKPGTGLCKLKKDIVPFELKFKNDTLLYEIIAN